MIWSSATIITVSFIRNANGSLKGWKDTNTECRWCAKGRRKSNIRAVQYPHPMCYGNWGEANSGSSLSSLDSDILFNRLCLRKYIFSLWCPQPISCAQDYKTRSRTSHHGLYHWHHQITLYLNLWAEPIFLLRTRLVFFPWEACWWNECSRFIFPRSAHIAQHVSGFYLSTQ